MSSNSDSTSNRIYFFILICAQESRLHGASCEGFLADLLFCTAKQLTLLCFFKYWPISAFLPYYFKKQRDFYVDTAKKKAW